MGRYKKIKLFKFESKIKEDFKNVSFIDKKIKELEENLKVKNNENITNEKYIFENIEKIDVESKNEYSLEEGIKKLEDAKVKFNKDDVLFVVRDESNQLIWLEKGNIKVGLEHIKFRHTKDFKKKFKIDPEEIPNLVKDIIKNSKILFCDIGYRNGILCLTKYYLYKNEYYVLGAIGVNGFISSIYPISKDDCEKKINKLGGNKNE